MGHHCNDHRGCWIWDGEHRNKPSNSASVLRLIEAAFQAYRQTDTRTRITDVRVCREHALELALRGVITRSHIDAVRVERRNTFRAYSSIPYVRFGKDYVTLRVEHPASQVILVYDGLGRVFSPVTYEEPA